MLRTTLLDIRIDLLLLAVGTKVSLLLAFWRTALAAVAAYTVLSPFHCQARQSVKGVLSKGGRKVGWEQEIWFCIRMRPFSSVFWIIPFPSSTSFVVLSALCQHPCASLSSLIN